MEKYGAHMQNAVVMSTKPLDWNDPSTWNGNIDRSPCGTGTSAIMTAMHAKGKLDIGETFVNEGILGAVFTGSLAEGPIVGGISTVIPTVSGTAWVTQISEIVVDPQDPVPDGYTLPDIW